MWFSLTAGSAPTIPNKTKCASSNDCILGSVCDVQNGICFWQIPIPTSGKYRVDAGGSTSFTFPFLPNGESVVWSGNIGICTEGTCDNSNSTICDLQGCSTRGPGALAEFTLGLKGVDFYDISIIGGSQTVSMEFTPVLPKNVSADPALPYNCGNPGGRVPRISSLPESNWTFSPPRIEYTAVTPASPRQTCAGTSDCTAPFRCGYAPALSGQSLELVCGTLQGYYTPGAICDHDPTNAIVNCTSPLGAPDTGLVVNNLYQCDAGLGSCYQNGAQSGCCGCADWPTAPPSTQKCANKNPLWVAIVEPQLLWLKHAVPTAYTFPFDDMSSTFVCSSINASGINVLAYNINLCV